MTGYKRRSAYFHITEVIGRPTVSGAIGFATGVAAGTATFLAIPTTGVIATFALPLASAAYHLTKRVTQTIIFKFTTSSADCWYHCRTLHDHENERSVAWRNIPMNCSTASALINLADFSNHTTCAWITTSLIKSLVEVGVGAVIIGTHWRGMAFIIGSGNLIGELASRTIRLKISSHLTPGWQLGFAVLLFSAKTSFSLASLAVVSREAKLVYKWLSNAPAGLTFLGGAISACRDRQQSSNTTINFASHDTCMCCVTVHQHSAPENSSSRSVPTHYTRLYR